MIRQQRYTSGILVIWSETGRTEALCRQIASAARNEPMAMAIVHYSVTNHDPDELNRWLTSLAPELPYCGCSTSGEITPEGVQECGALAILLPQRWFSADTQVIDQIDRRGMDEIVELATAHRTHFERLAGVEHYQHSFAISLIDGLTCAEDAVTAAIARALVNIPLIGGSAGDSLRFQQTTQICNGQCHTRAAVLLLVHSRLPFELFTNNAFMPTPFKLVVTEVDQDTRTVFELNAEPAADAYAAAIGLDDSRELTPLHFASNAVGVSCGGDFYSRSIQRLNDDLSLTFFGAIDNGLVLTVARSTGTLDSLDTCIVGLEQQLGPIDMMFGFDCIYRKIDARHRNIIGRMESLYCKKRFVGFNSYGEQFRGMHVNQTFTGIAFGLPGGTGGFDARSNLAGSGATYPTMARRTPRG